MKTVLVIPAYNEEKYIKELLLRAKQYSDYVIVVDDGSKDNTYTQAKKVGGNVIALRHKVNFGKGSAMKTGCEVAKRLKADIVVFIDGDGQHPPEEIPGMLEYMESNHLDVVFSARQGGDKMPLVRSLGNHTLNFFAQHLFNLHVRDIWCGFRAIRTACLAKVSWTKCDYSGEIQMALKVGLNKLAYGEYTIPTIYHDVSKGVTIINGLKLLPQMIIWRLMLL